MWKLVPSLALVLACTQPESRLDPALLPSSHAGSAAATPSLAAPADVEARLARVERRLDRVIALLQQNLPPAAPQPKELYAVPLAPLDPILGPADAKVTVVEVFEFACAQCEDVAIALDQLRAKYPADVRVVGKYLAVRGQTGVMAGLVACAASLQGKYEAVKLALWKSNVAADTKDPEAAKRLATAVGADAKRLESDLVKCQGWFESSRQPMRGLGVTSVPTLFINGRALEAPLSLQIIEDAILEARQKATDDIAAGVPAADVYQRTVLDRGMKQAKSPFDD